MKNGVCLQRYDKWDNWGMIFHILIFKICTKYPHLEGKSIPELYFFIYSFCMLNITVCGGGTFESPRNESCCGHVGNRKVNFVRWGWSVKAYLTIFHHHQMALQRGLSLLSNRPLNQPSPLTWNTIFQLCS